MSTLLTELVVITHYSASTLGLIFNLFLLYLIIKHTPPILKTYSVLVFNACLTDTLSCVSSILTITRIIPTGSALIYIFHGLCSFIGSDFCYYSYSFLLHTYAHSLFVILVSFIFRYLVITRPFIRLRLVVVCLVLVYLPSFTQFVSLCFDKEDEEDIRALISQYHPTYNITGLTVSGNTDAFSPITLITIIYVTAPIVPVYLGIFWLRINIYKRLKEKATHFSSNTIRTHKQLARALSIHACLPALFLLSVLCFFWIQFVNQGPVGETLTYFFVSFIPSLSPLVSIYFIRPYREKTKQILTMRRKLVIPQSMSYQKSTTPYVIGTP